MHSAAAASDEPALSAELREAVLEGVRRYRRHEIHRKSQRLAGFVTAPQGVGGEFRRGPSDALASTQPAAQRMTARLRRLNRAIDRL